MTDYIKGVQFTIPAEGLSLISKLEAWLQQIYFNWNQRLEQAEVGPDSQMFLQAPNSNVLPYATVAGFLWVRQTKP